MVNILLSSCGRRVELLRAFRSAYRTLNVTGKIVATDIDPLAPALQEADLAFLVPRVADARYVEALVGICRRESIGLVIPLIDPEIPILAKAHDAFRAVGSDVAVIALAATEVAGDKWRTYEFFCRIGIATPKSWLPGDPSLAEASFPLFIKPRAGSAAQGAFHLSNKEELEFFSSYIRDPIIQECIEGPEITTDVVAWQGGRLLAIVSRRRIEVRWGEVSKGVTVRDELVFEGCRKIAAALPATAPITVQCFLREGVPCFTEINARLGGGLPLAVAAGADVPAMILARLVGLRCDFPMVGDYREGVYMTRYDDSFFLEKHDLKRIEGSHL